MSTYIETTNEEQEQPRACGRPRPLSQVIYCFLLVFEVFLKALIGGLGPFKRV